MKIYIELFLSWSKIGLFTFGGGYAMLPMIEKEIIDKKHWATYEEVMDYFAIGQCTPGVIAVNTATFIGYKIRGLTGGIVATLGVVTPSFIIITLIASALSNFSEILVVIYALDGIKIGVCVLMFSSIIKLFKKSIIDKYSFIIFACVLALAVVFKINTLVLILLAGILGVLFSLIKLNGENK